MIKKSGIPFYEEVMLLLSKISGGDVAEIQLSKHSIVESQIYDIDKDSIVLFRPYIDSVPVNLKHSQELDILVFKESALYQFKAIVIQTSYKKRNDLILTKLKGKVEKIQRRNYFRINRNLQVEINELGNFMTLNISGGGMSICSNEIIENGTILTGNIKLPTSDSIDFVAETVRHSKSIKLDSKAYEIGMKFEEISQESKDADRKSVV